MGHWGDRPTSGVSACTVSERGMVPLGNPRRHLRHAPSCPYDKARKLGYLSPNSLFAIFGRLLPDTIILQHFGIVLSLNQGCFHGQKEEKKITLRQRAGVGCKQPSSFGGKGRETWAEWPHPALLLDVSSSCAFVGLRHLLECSGFSRLLTHGSPQATCPLGQSCVLSWV